MISGINYLAKMLTKKSREVQTLVQTGYFRLRRRSTRYKNPQLFVQPCLVASFGSMFLVFYQLFYLFQLVCSRLKKVVVGRWSSLSNRFWLRCWFFIELPTCLGSGHTYQINQSARYISSTWNNFFCCVTLPDKLKKRNIDPKLATK